MEKTHWKKIVSDPNYLGEADFDEGEEKVATIAKVAQSETVVTAEGKSSKAVVHFAENLKPMILNVARSKAIEKVVGSPYFEDWPGTRIQLYIDHGIKAFGEIVSAVRVRDRKPAERQPVICERCGKPIQGGGGKSAGYVAAYTKKKYGAALCWECATEAAKPKDEVKEDAPDVPDEADAG